jgi:NADH-quinone oxidoreductase subunit M
VGEFLIFNGVFGLVPWSAAISLLGLLFTAIFFLRAIRKVFHGPLPHGLAAWPDLSASDRWLFAPAVAMIVIPGLWPQVLLQFVNGDTLRLLERLNPIP